MSSEPVKPIPAEIRAKFATPIPDRYIQKKPGKSQADYVAHPVIRQYLMALTDAHREEVVREEAIPSTGTRKNGAEYTYTKVAMLVRLSVCIDGVWYGPWEEWGESENESNPWKSAQSDAIKRLCAMHLGLGLHLWARGHYFLDKAISREVGDAAEEVDDSKPAVDDGLATEEPEPQTPPDIPVPAGPSTPPPAEPTDPPPAEGPAPLNRSFFASWKQLMKKLDADEATERACLEAIYGDAAHGEDDKGARHSIKFMDPDAARALLHGLKEGKSDGTPAEDVQQAFLDKGLTLLAERAQEGEDDG